MTRSKAAALLEKIVRIIPGIAGYQDREMVRDTDKVVRERAALPPVSGLPAGGGPVLLQVRNAGRQGPGLFTVRTGSSIRLEILQPVR